MKTRRQPTKFLLALGDLGYSLPEVLIASVVLVIVLMAIYIVYDTGIQDYARGTARADVQQNVRVALDNMARELRTAGYSPSATGCTTPPSGTITAISTSPVSVTFLADVGKLNNDGCLDQVTYTFVPPTDLTKPCDSSNPATIGSITRSIQEWSAGAWSPVTPTAYDVAQCVTALTMTYYDSSGATITNPADVGKITRITVSITGTENTRGWGVRTYTLTSDVRLRNL
jgi:prepilin-type N-terminal cleavage/methylation domain-containing protein